DRETLQGTWVAVKGEVNGNPLIDTDVAANVLTFVGDRVTYRTKRWTQEGPYRLDPARSPKAIDMNFTLGMAAIYELTASRLAVCWSKRGPRPGGFDTAAEPDTFLYVFARR